MLYVSPFRTNLSSWQSGASCAHSLRVIVWQERFSNYGFRLLFSLLPCHLFNCLYLHISRLNFKVSSLCYFHSVVSDNESRQMRAQNQALRCNTEPSLQCSVVLKRCDAPLLLPVTLIRHGKLALFSMPYQGRDGFYYTCGSMNITLIRSHREMFSLAPC